MSPRLSAALPPAKLRASVDGWQVTCPGCAQWADLSDAQLYGRLPLAHGCGYTTARNWAATSERVG